MNKFSYSIIMHFIPSNKDYHSCCKFHLVSKRALKVQIPPSPIIDV